MMPQPEFWNGAVGVTQPLETEVGIRRLVNKHVVATLMNAFPRTATNIFSRSNGELARLLFADREGGSYRVLRAMYQYNNGQSHGDLINRLLMQSPAVKAARNRRTIAQKMLERSLEMLPSGRPILVLAVGGGDGNQEAEVIARAARPDIYYCGVDRDERAVEENREVLNQFGLADRGYTLVGSVNDQNDVRVVLEDVSRHFKVDFEGVSVCVCQGIAEYVDMDCDTNEALVRMLSAIQACTLPQGRLLISQTDYHDRVRYLEKGLCWRMRLRSREELASVVRQSGWQISICEPEPMGLITMCLAANQRFRATTTE